MLTGEQGVGWGAQRN